MNLSAILLNHWRAEILNRNGCWCWASDVNEHHCQLALLIAKARYELGQNWATNAGGSFIVALYWSTREENKIWNTSLPEIVGLSSQFTFKMELWWRMRNFMISALLSLKKTVLKFSLSSVVGEGFRTLSMTWISTLPDWSLEMFSVPSLL